MKKAIAVLVVVALTGCNIARRERVSREPSFSETEIAQDLPDPVRIVSIPDEEYLIEDMLAGEKQGMEDAAGFAEPVKGEGKETPDEGKKEEEPVSGKKTGDAQGKEDLSEFSAWTGECLVYQIKWNFMCVGKGLLACQKEKTKYGEVYHMTAITVPEGAFAAWGYGYYRTDSYVDPETLRPHYSYTYMRNGKSKKIIEAIFDSGKNEFRWEEKKYREDTLKSTKSGKISHDSPVYDSVTAFYLLRTFDFTEKTDFHIRVGIKEVWDLIVRKKGEKHEEIPALGEKRVLVVEPEASSDEGLFTKGKMTLWLTADERKTPVFFEGKAPLGSGTLSLISRKKIPSDMALDSRTIAWILNAA